MRRSRKHTHQSLKKRSISLKTINYFCFRCFELIQHSCCTFLWKTHINYCKPVCNLPRVFIVNWSSPYSQETSVIISVHKLSVQIAGPIPSRYLNIFVNPWHWFIYQRDTNPCMLRARVQIKNSWFILLRIFYLVYLDYWWGYNLFTWRLVPTCFLNHGWHLRLQEFQIVNQININGILKPQNYPSEALERKNILF